jgi:hypothetical protein
MHHQALQTWSSVSMAGQLCSKSFKYCDLWEAAPAFDDLLDAGSTDA